MNRTSLQWGSAIVLLVSAALAWGHDISSDNAILMVAGFTLAGYQLAGYSFA